MEIGKIQHLKIKRFSDFGAYLSDGSKEVLLPKKQVLRTAKEGDELEVFVYKDSSDRIIATTKKPLITVGEISILTVKDVTEIGAFVDIGLERDVLVPFKEMRYRLQANDRVECYLYVDKSERLCATTYTEKFKTGDNQVSSEKRKEMEYELAANKVYKFLKEKFKGHYLYTDKTASPEIIEKDFGLSKAAFKRGVGKLLKEGHIKINDGGIWLIY